MEGVRVNLSLNIALIRSNVLYRVRIFRGKIR